MATCFPKPLTISHHTLRAVQAGDLTPAEWRRLRVQSRLHSKEGRDFAMLLARLNIPIMGFNSMTQRIIPPPKYMVDRLVDCTDHPKHARREPLRDRARRARRCARSTRNPRWRRWWSTPTTPTASRRSGRWPRPSSSVDDDYAELRRKEKVILASAMRNVRVRGIASDDFSWADRIADAAGFDARRALRRRR